jgi:hypothetical protein
MQNTDLRGSTLERLGFYLGHQWKNSSWIKRSFIIAVALIVLSVAVRIGGGDGSPQSIVENAGSDPVRLMRETAVKLLASLAVYDKYCGGLPAAGLDSFKKIAPMVSKLELDEEFPNAVERMRSVGEEEFCAFMKRGFTGGATPGLP